MVANNFNEQQHKQQLCDLANGIPITDDLIAMTSFFKAVSDPTRMRILLALAKTPLSVNEIVDILAMSQSSISHQLSLLKQAKLVTSQRRGRNIHYQLADEHIITIFQQTKAHLFEER